MGDSRAHTGEPVRRDTDAREALGKFANTLFSFRATRTTFRPYQFKPVLKFLADRPRAAAHRG